MHFRQATAACIAHSPPLLFGFRWSSCLMRRSSAPQLIVYRRIFTSSRRLACHATDSCRPTQETLLRHVLCRQAPTAQAAVKIRPGPLRPLDSCLCLHRHRDDCYVRVSASPSRTTTIVSPPDSWAGTQKGQRNCAPPVRYSPLQRVRDRHRPPGWSMTRSSHSTSQEPNELSGCHERTTQGSTRTASHLALRRRCSDAYAAGTRYVYTSTYRLSREQDGIRDRGSRIVLWMEGRDGWVE
jgi:hypothetical protein